MSLYKRNGLLCYHFEMAGQRYRRSTGTANRKKAEAIEARARVAAERGESLMPQRAPILRDFAARFIKFIEESRLAGKSQRDYKNGWRLLKASRLAGMRIDQITTDDVETTKIHESPFSTNCAIRTLRRMLHKAKGWKEMKDVPRLKMAKVRPRSMVFSKEIELAVLARSTPMLADLLVLTLDSGMRDGEAVSMRWEFVNFDGGYYHNPDGKTARARRIVPLSDRVIAMLRRRGTALQGWVFRSEKSRSGHVELHKLQLRFRKICRELGISDGLKLHCARHTFGTFIMKETGNPALVKETMGHSDLRTTMDYLHPNVQELKAVIDKRNLEQMPALATERIM